MAVSVVRRSVLRVWWSLALVMTSVGRAGAMPQRTAACAGKTPDSATSGVKLEAVAAAAGDSTRTVHVCVRPARGTSIGSFHLVIEYDSTVVRASRFLPGGSGSEVANLSRAGRADIAGAAPTGFASGSLMQIVFAPAGARLAGSALGSMTVRLLELNATDGANLVAHSTVAGLGGRASERRTAAAPPVPANASRVPHIDRLDPARTRLAPGEPTQVMIFGSGFRPEGNIVLLGDVVVGELRSADGATLRLVLPDALPSTSEVPPRRLGPGAYGIRVRTGAGTSNSIELVLEVPR